jgi:hypothetical protein
LKTPENIEDVLIEDVFHEQTRQPMPEEMKARILQNLRAADVRPAREARRRSRHWGSIAAGAAAVLIVGAGALVANQHGVFSPKMPVKSKVPSNMMTGASRVNTTIYAQEIKGKNLDVVYPQISGLQNSSVQRQINAELKHASGLTNQIQTNTAGGEEKYYTSYQVTYHQGDIASFLFLTTDDTGGAHPGNGVASITVDLRNGHQYHLADLFKPKSTYVQQISGVIRKQAAQRQLTFTSPFTSIHKNDVWVMTPSGFAIVASSYEYFSYAVGTPAFTIPFSDVSSSINQQGQLWQTLRNATSNQDDLTRKAAITWMQTHGYELFTANGMTNSGPATAEATTPTAGNQTLSAYVGLKQTRTGGPDEEIFFFAGSKHIKTVNQASVTNILPLGESTIGVTHQSNGQENGTTTRYTWNGQRLVANSSVAVN